MVNISLPDGSVSEFPDGTTPLQVAQSISGGLAKAAIGANGTRRCGKYCPPIKFVRDANGAVGLPKETSGDTRAVV